MDQQEKYQGIKKATELPPLPPIQIEVTQKKPLPLFEVLISLFSLYMAAIMFMYPGALEQGSGNAGIAYEKILNVTSQRGWAMMFFVAAIIKIVGLLARKRMIRILGLGCSVFIYSILAGCFMYVFPNFTVGIFALLALTSLIQIFYADYFDFT